MEEDGFKHSVRGKEVALKIKFRLSELDRKAADSITGLGGVFCDFCFNSKEEAHKSSCVQALKVEKTLKSTMEICQKLPATPSGDLKTTPGDYNN